MSIAEDHNGKFGLHPSAGNVPRDCVDRIARAEPRAKVSQRTMKIAHLVRACLAFLAILENHSVSPLKGTANSGNRPGLSSVRVCPSLVAGAQAEARLIAEL